MNLPPIAPSPRRSHTLRNVLVGCGVLVLLAAVGTGLLIYTNVSRWITRLRIEDKYERASFATQHAWDSIDESNLSERLKKRFLGRISSVRSDVVADRLSLDEALDFADRFCESRLFDASTVEVIESRFLVRSGLGPEEKARAKRTIDRLMRGLVEDRIDGAELENIVWQIAHDVGNDPYTQHLKERVTDDELRDFLRQAAEVVQEHKIADEPFAIDIPAALDKAFDDALARSRR
jgi:hypothetical protein